MQQAVEPAELLFHCVVQILVVVALSLREIHHENSGLRVARGCDGIVYGFEFGLRPSDQNDCSAVACKSTCGLRPDAIAGTCYEDDSVS